MGGGTGPLAEPAEHPDTLTTRGNLAHWTEQADSQAEQ